MVLFGARKKDRSAYVTVQLDGECWTERFADRGAAADRVAELTSVPGVGFTITNDGIQTSYDDVTGWIL